MDAITQQKLEPWEVKNLREDFSKELLQEACSKIVLEGDKVVSLEPRHFIYFLHKMEHVSRFDVVQEVRTRLGNIGIAIHQKNLELRKTGKSDEIPSAHALGYTIAHFEYGVPARFYPESSRYVKMAKGIVESITNQLINEIKDEVTPKIGMTA